MYTIRGAITVENNDENEILEATSHLLKEMIHDNKISVEEIRCVYFTATVDLTKVYPARAARNMGILNAALMCVQEMYVENSLMKCIRICMFCDGEKSQTSVKHVYRRGAEILRPDFFSSKVIAIDGPAGAGKSTVAKLVAEALNFIYLDTGAMYRALTFKAIESGANLDDENNVFDAVNSSILDFDETGIILDGKSVEKEIRSINVTNNVSKVSSYKKIREQLVDFQRKIAIGKNSVVDGRDIGTVVFPKAWLKIFLTASVDERAERRFKEINENKKNETNEKLKETLEDVKRMISDRDYQDMNREISPLKQAEDAVLVDTTSKNIEKVVNDILVLAKEKN